MSGWEVGDEAEYIVFGDRRRGTIALIPADPGEERRVERLTAERLISTADLIDALRWHRHPSLGGLADALWVDEATVRCRLETMDTDEQALIELALGDAA